MKITESSSEEEKEIAAANQRNFETSDSHMAECIENCLTCFRACEEEFYQCLLRGENYLNASHLQLLQTCAAICQTTAQFMMLHSPYHSRLCGICATVCEACAESCENYSDQHSRRCSKLCRVCAQSCEQMSMMTN